MANKMRGMAGKTAGGLLLVGFSALISAPAYLVAGLISGIAGLRQTHNRELAKEKGLTPSKTTGTDVFLKGTKLGGKLLAAFSTLFIATLTLKLGKDLLRSAGWK